MRRMEQRLDKKSNVLEDNENLRLKNVHLLLTLLHLPWAPITRILQQLTPGMPQNFFETQGDIQIFILSR